MLKKKGLLLVMVFVMANLALVSADFCYQESANVSTECGGKDTGSYVITGIWIGINNTYDGNWTTYGNGNNVNLFINYTKPLGVMNSSLWQVKDFSMINITILQSCFDYSINELAFKVNSDTGTSAFTTWYCFDGLWQQLRQDDNGYAPVYEEAMYWDIPSSTVSKKHIISNDTGSVIELDVNGSIKAFGNISATDSTKNGFGFFRFLGSIVNRITKGWFHNLDVSGSINGTTINGSTIFSNNVNISNWITNISLNYTAIVNSIYNQTWNYNYSGNITGSTNWTQVMVGTYNLTWNYNYSGVNYTQITFNLYNATWDNSFINLYFYNHSSLFNLQNVLNSTGLYTYNYNQTMATFNLYNATWDNSYLNNLAINHTSVIFTTYNSTWDNNWVNQYMYNHSLLVNLQNVLNSTGIYSGSVNHTQIVFDIWNNTFDNSWLNTLNFTNIIFDTYNSTWNYNYSFNYSDSLLNSYNNWTYNQTYAQDNILSTGKEIYLSDGVVIYSNGTCTIIKGQKHGMEVC